MILAGCCWTSNNAYQDQKLSLGQLLQQFLPGNWLGCKELLMSCKTRKACSQSLAPIAKPKVIALASSRTCDVAILPLSYLTLPLSASRKYDSTHIRWYSISTFFLMRLTPKLKLLEEPCRALQKGFLLRATHCL